MPKERKRNKEKNEDKLRAGGDNCTAYSVKRLLKDQNKTERKKCSVFVFHFRSCVGYLFGIAIAASLLRAAGSHLWTRKSGCKTRPGN
jgi:hypothetical protein